MTVRNGAIHQVNCKPDEAPESETCGTFNGTFAAHGRVWVTPEGRVVASANRNWDTTATVELPRASTTLTRPRTVTLPHTVTPQQSESESLPMVERPQAPANTTTRLYWANYQQNEIWVADVNQTDGTGINPRLFLQGGLLDTPWGIDFDPQNDILYWSNVGSGAISKIYMAKVNASSSALYERQLLTTTVSTRGLVYDKNENTLYWRNSADLTYGQINNTSPATVMNVRSFFSSIVYGFSIDTLHQKIYWAESYELFVGDINVTTQSINNRHLLYGSSNKPPMLWGVTIDTHNSKIYFRDENDIFVAHINITFPSLGIFNTKPFLSKSSATIKGQLGGLCIVHFEI